MIVLIWTSNVYSQVNIHHKDSPLKEVVTQVLDSQKVQYQINTNLLGYVNVKFTNQSLDNSLKMLFRGTNYSFKIENEVYIIEERKLPLNIGPPPVLPVQVIEKKVTYTVIPLTYLDPKDLEPLFGPFLYVKLFSRKP